MVINLGGGNIAERCSPGACEVVSQNPCTSAQKCGYVSNGTSSSRACVANGTVAEDGTCGAGGADDCARGMTCVTFSGAASAKCAKYCNANTDCTGNKVCNAALTVTGTNEVPTVCNATPATCSLLTQNCTTGTDGCYLTQGSDGGTTTGCFPAGSTADGQSCAAGNNCTKGSLCAGAAGSTTCRKLCNTDGGAPNCTTGTCNPLGNAPGAGVCQ